MFASLHVAAALAGLFGTQAPSLGVDYDATEGCPPEKAFRAEISRRIADVRTSGRAVEVRISKEGDVFEGHVAVSDEGGASPPRTVRASTCEEVVRALALSVVTALDAEEPQAPPAPNPPSPPPADAPTVASRPISAKAQWSIGATGGVDSANGPLMSPTAAIFGEFAIREVALRLTLGGASSPVVERAYGSASFSKLIATIDACPLGLRSGRFLLKPCPFLEIGTLMAEGRSTVSPESTTRLWAAAGLATIFAVDVAGPVFVEVEGRSRIPFVRESFYFRPNNEVFRAPQFAFSFGISAGVHFP